MRKTITIDVRGVDGESSATFDLADWLDMNPLARVRALHERCRNALAGQRFDILAERRA